MTCWSQHVGARPYATVLSAEPVASRNSLKGLNARQLTSATCASTEQGLTLDQFSAQLERFLGIGGARRGCVARFKGVLGVLRVCRVISCVRHGSS